MRSTYCARGAAINSTRNVIIQVINTWRVSYLRHAHITVRGSRRDQVRQSDVKTLQYTTRGESMEMYDFEATLKYQTFL